MQSAVLCEPQPLTLAALATYLEDQGFEILCSTADAREAVATVAERCPRFVVFGVEAADEAPSAIKRLREVVPDIRVLVYGPNRPDVAAEALRHGADAYVLRVASLDDLAVAIRQLENRTIYLANPAVSAPGALTPLTEKERELLSKLASSGAKTSELARDLGVREQTIKFHLTNIYKKLGLKNRTEAAVWAREHGLV